MRTAVGMQQPMMSSGYGGGGGMGMGSMGMGMGSMSSLGMLSMMGMGMGGIGAGSGPLSWIYSINYFITSVGHMVSVLGMNSHALLRAYQAAHTAILGLVTHIRTSEMRRVLQRKCKRSTLLRFLFVAGCSTLCGAALKILHLYWSYFRTGRIGYAAGGAGLGGAVVPSLTGYSGSTYGYADAGRGVHGGGGYGPSPPPSLGGQSISSASANYL